MIFDPNPLFHEIVSLYQKNRFEKDKAGEFVLDKNGNKKAQVVTICNEGGTRSSKTWDFFHFLVAFCSHNKGKENEIYIIRETLVKCKDYTLKEFKKCLKVIGVWDVTNFVGSPKPYYNLWGNHIYFRGLDDPDTEGYPSDILFINEALEVSEKKRIDDLALRCSKLIVMDWNPKYTRHWCFDIEVQPNVFFTHSTYLNNKHLSEPNRKKIIGFEPWLSGSYEVKERKLYYQGELITEKNQPPPHPENVGYLTADEYRWKVYGLGLRGAMEGLILTNVVYVEPDEWPEGLEGIYVNDFGFTSDPNALIDFAMEGNNIYVRILAYHPVETPGELNRLYEALGMDKKKIIMADSSDKFVSEHKGAIEMVRGMRLFNWIMRKISKTKSVMFWLLKLKEYRINIIKDKAGLWKHAQIEFENYRLKKIDGHIVNQPDDKCQDHAIDCIRYGLMTYSKRRTSF